MTSEDSDSDSELKRLAETSRNQLILSEANYMTMADHSFVRIAMYNYSHLVRFLRVLLRAIAAAATNKAYNIANSCYQRACNIKNRVTGSIRGIFSLIY